MSVVCCIATCSDGSSSNEGASEVGTPAGEISSSNAAPHGTRTPQSTNHRGCFGSVDNVHTWRHFGPKC